MVRCDPLSRNVSPPLLNLVSVLWELSRVGMRTETTLYGEVMQLEIVERLICSALFAQSVVMLCDLVVSNSLPGR